MKALLKRWPLLLVAVLAASMLLVACGESKEEAKTTPGATAKATAGEWPGNTDGVSPTEIKIGTLLPMSNTPATTWGTAISQGMQAYADYINDNGGIYGRKINLIIGDTQYTGPVAIEAARKLVEQDKVFALQAGLGTEAMNATYRYLEEKGVPDMWMLTGESYFTDPVSRNRFSWLVDYLEEGRILGQYIGKNFDGKKVGILAQNDDFGKEGEEGVKLGIQDAGATMDSVTEYYDSTQTDVTAQTQRLKNDNVDVIAVYAMPQQAASLMHTARETLNWDVPFVVTGVDAVEIQGALSGYANIEGAVSVVYGHQAYETDWPGIAAFRANLEKYGKGAGANNLSLTGYVIMQATVYLLEQTGPDLTRDAFLTTAESMCKWDAPVGIAPASLSPTDHRFTQVERYVKATGVDVDFRWEFTGDNISFESTEDCTVPTPFPEATTQPPLP
jgi:branched-chain amino acid transport system substrate-binding protein